MKKTLIILLIFISDFAFSHPNNLVNDSTVSFITYFDKGDSYDYSYTITKQKFILDSLVSHIIANADFKLTVTDANADSYIFDWQNYEANEAGERNPVLLSVPELSKGTRYIYKTDEVGIYEELINVKEIGDNLKHIIDSLFSTLPENTIKKGIYDQLITKFASKQMVESTAKSVQIYHAMYGAEYTLNDTMRLETELPNPFGGTPLPALYTVVLSEINYDAGYCVLKATQNIDKEKGKDFILEYMNYLMPEEAKGKIDEKRIPLIEISDFSTHVMDLNYGWMLFIENIRIIEIDSTKQIETLTCEMKDENLINLGIHTFNTWGAFLENFDNEIRRAEDLYENLKANGLKKYQKSVIEIHFESDSKTKLQNIREFLESNYGFIFQEEMVHDDNFGIRMTTDSIPVSKETLIYLSIDLAKRAFEYDCGVVALRTQVDKSPTFPILELGYKSVYYDKAFKEYKNGNISKAMIYWTLMIEIDSTNEEIYYNRAVAKNELLLLYEALLDYDNALEINPNYKYALLNRASLREDMEDFEGAISDVDKLIALEPINAKAYFHRGNIKIKMGNQEAACIDWEKAIEFGMEDAQEMFDQFCK